MTPEEEFFFARHNPDEITRYDLEETERMAFGDRLSELFKKTKTQELTLHTDAYSIFALICEFSPRRLAEGRFLAHATEAYQTYDLFPAMPLTREDEYQQRTAPSHSWYIVRLSGKKNQCEKKLRDDIVEWDAYFVNLSPAGSPQINTATSKVGLLMTHLGDTMAFEISEELDRTEEDSDEDTPLIRREAKSKPEYGIELLDGEGHRALMSEFGRGITVLEVPKTRSAAVLSTLPNLAA